MELKAVMGELSGVFSRNLRQLRKTRGLNQEQVAEAAGITHAYYGHIERGDSWPSIKILEAIAAALGVHPWELFFDGGDPSNMFPFLTAIQDRINMQGTHIKQVMQGVREIAKDREHLNETIAKIKAKQSLPQIGKGHTPEMDEKFRQFETMLSYLREQLESGKKGSGTDGDGTGA